MKRYILLCPRGLWFSLYKLTESVDEGFMAELVATLAEKQRGSFAMSGDDSTLTDARRGQNIEEDAFGMEKEKAAV